MSLAKMGVGTISFWDDDTVEEHNLPNQWYELDDLGQKKVMALARHVERIADDVEIYAHDSKYHGQSMPDVVICCVDSMAARHMIWRHVKRQRTRGGNPRLYIDTRMSAETGNIFAVPAQWEEDYESTHMFPPSEAVDLPCTAKSTVYAAAICAAGACAQLKQWVEGEELVPMMTIDMLRGQHLTLDPPAEKEETERLKEAA
tara:strand:- start:166 stop:771 length:606 start_codon:yes stop_codon:yes gene_type:complete